MGVAAGVLSSKRAQPALDELKKSKAPRPVCATRNSEQKPAAHLRQPIGAGPLSPKFSCLVGVCTHLGCIPLFDPQPSATDPAPRLAGRLLLPLPWLENTISPAASSRAFPHPTICRFRPTIFPDDKTVRVGQKPAGRDFRFQLDPASLASKNRSVASERAKRAKRRPMFACTVLTLFSRHVPRPARPVAGRRRAGPAACGRWMRATFANRGSAAIGPVDDTPAGRRALEW